MRSCMCYKLKHFIEIFFSWSYKLSSRLDIYFFQYIYYLVAYFSFGKYIVYQVGNTVSIRQPVSNWNHCCHTNFKLSQSVKAACPQKVFSFATRYMFLRCVLRSLLSSSTIVMPLSSLPFGQIKRNIAPNHINCIQFFIYRTSHLLHQHI